jgi:hypothetical protein
MNVSHSQVVRVFLLVSFPGRIFIDKRCFPNMLRNFFTKCFIHRVKSKGLGVPEIKGTQGWRLKALQFGNTSTQGG